MSQITYTDLHLHSEYSLKDGMIRVADADDYEKKREQIIIGAERRNTGAVTCTDHGNMYAHGWLAKVASIFGLKHIPGCEFYVAPESRLIKSSSKGEITQYHICAWAKNKLGYQNMCMLSYLSYKEGFYFNPRIDRELIDKYGDGIIWSDACVSGILSKRILDGRSDEAFDLFMWFLDRFKDDFYIEYQNHHLEIEAKANNEKCAWAHRHGVPVIATTDAHYFSKEDAEAHRTLLCMQYNNLYDNPLMEGFLGDGYHIMSEEELLERYLAEYLNNTQLIVDKVEPHIIEFSNIIPPQFDVPDWR